MNEQLKRIAAPIAIVVALIVVGGLLAFLARPNNVLGSPAGDNNFGAANITVATTVTTLPVKVLSLNYGRKYAAFVNDSDTVVYIYLGDFANSSTASTTVVANAGIRINANGGSYEILPENLYTGEVWMATTTAGKKLLVTESN